MFNSLLRERERDTKGPSITSFITNTFALNYLFNYLFIYSRGERQKVRKQRFFEEEEEEEEEELSLVSVLLARARESVFDLSLVSSRERFCCLFR